jgi:hypothetical protein
VSLRGERAELFPIGRRSEAVLLHEGEEGLGWAVLIAVLEGFAEAE